jgi:uncharacterized Zn finger protein (UPF0148 family)
LAAVIYGDNPDSNLLERAVRWVIIMLVIVFDPLAIMMVLASTESMKWERERRKALDIPESSLLDEEDTPDETSELCPKCDTELQHAPGIGDYCPNFACDVADDIIGAKMEKEAELPTAHFREVEIIEAEDYDDDEVHDDGPHNYKKASKIWKMINTHTTLKEQRKMYQRGQIERLPWTEPEFIARVESGEFD